MLEIITFAIMLCALAPAVLFCVNLRLYLPPPNLKALSLPAVSVLIPARDEELTIKAAVTSVLASQGITFELIVMDDDSTDRTAGIVEAIAAKDTRVQLQHSLQLPIGWNGKQHACWVLAHKSRYELLCFVDADVRLAPEALARVVGFIEKNRADLVSGFPRQIAGTWLERLLLPLIHLVLLGFLPIEQMRKTTAPAFAAGCGQFILVRRKAYFACGGHAEIKATMHDGLLLPRLFRLHNYSTDLTDLTGLATCRMYRNARQVWFGLAKNATEGIADPARILPISLLLILGQILPYIFAVWFALRGGVSLEVWAYVLVGVTAAWLPRILASVRFRQSWLGAIMHPVGVITLLAIQWFALLRKIIVGTVNWKDRAYANR